MPAIDLDFNFVGIDTIDRGRVNLRQHELGGLGPSVAEKIAREKGNRMESQFSCDPYTWLNLTGGNSGPLTQRGVREMNRANTVRDHVAVVGFQGIIRLRAKVGRLVSVGPDVFLRLRGVDFDRLHFAPRGLVDGVNVESPRRFGVTGSILPINIRDWRNGLFGSVADGGRRLDVACVHRRIRRVEGEILLAHRIGRVKACRQIGSILNLLEGAPKKFGVIAGNKNRGLFGVSSCSRLSLRKSAELPSNKRVKSRFDYY